MFFWFQYFGYIWYFSFPRLILVIFVFVSISSLLFFYFEHNILAVIHLYSFEHIYLVIFNFCSIASKTLNIFVLVSPIFLLYYAFVLFVIWNAICRLHLIFVSFEYNILVIFDLCSLQHKMLLIFDRWCSEYNILVVFNFCSFEQNILIIFVLCYYSYFKHNVLVIFDLYSFELKHFGYTRPFWFDHNNLVTFDLCSFKYNIWGIYIFWASTCWLYFISVPLSTFSFVLFSVFIDLCMTRLCHSVICSNLCLTSFFYSTCHFFWPLAIPLKTIVK